jgi:hypothetical protein
VTQGNVVDDRGREDEAVFFAALARLLPGTTVLHNREDRAVQRYFESAGVRMPNHHWDQDLPPDVASAMDLVFERLQGRREAWKDADHARYLDGYLAGGELGPCLVEFDEEQHFSPFRLTTLEILGPVVRPSFDLTRYIDYCLNPACFEQFWRKHRLPSELLRPGQAPPRSALEFTGTLLRRLPPGRASRYYAPVSGFPFLGGRIAQRAYYDALRDCYHLTAEGRRLGLRPMVRIAKYEVEGILGKDMGAAGDEELRAAVLAVLPASGNESSSG